VHLSRLADLPDVPLAERQLNALQADWREWRSLSSLKRTGYREQRPPLAVQLEPQGHRHLIPIKVKPQQVV